MKTGWYIKMLLGGCVMDVLVEAKNLPDAEGEAVKWCIRNGYSAGQFLSIKQIKGDN